MEILQNGAEVLRKTAIEVPISEIKSAKIQNIIKKMSKLLDKEEDGVAIAAPQIGEALRIFVVSGKVLSPNYPDLKAGEEIPENLAFINPKIVKLSKRKKKMAEGCLSIRWLYGDVQRSIQATIEAHDAQGNTFTRGASGLLAQIFQHEYDHLDGVLFIDKAENVENLPPEKDSKHTHVE